MLEKWTSIPDYDGLYEVSNMGHVRGVDRWVEVNGGRKFVPGKVLKTEKQKRDGHLRVPLSKDGNQKRFLVHRLVLFAFVGYAEEGQECLHINGNPEDNRLSNLKWGTRSENANDTIKHGSHVNASKVDCPRGHPLISGNLVLHQFELYGKRICLSCARARALLVHRGTLSDDNLKDLSDEYFNKIKETI